MKNGNALGDFKNQAFAEYTQYAVARARAGHDFEARILPSIIQYPVSIREFVEGPEYLDQANSIYPVVLDELEALNNPKVEGLNHGLRIGSTYTEAVFTGGIGVGKSHCALLTTAYQLYVLSCLDEPQEMFDLDPSSEILFVFQTLNATLAKQLDFARFKSMVSRSPYFKRVFAFNPDIESELRFPNRIIVRPVTGLESGTIGQNVFGGILDEVNFMEHTKNSRKATDGGEYDQAVALYSSISNRRKSRFMKQGKMMGMLCLVSSKRYPNQFTDQKQNQAKKELAQNGSSSIFIYDKRRWEIKPDDFCGERFKVFVGDLVRMPRIIESDEQAQENDAVLEVPIEYRQEFEQDTIRALREIGGLSTTACHPFLPNIDLVSKCFGHQESILNRESTHFADDHVHVHRARILFPNEARFVHVDLALSRDSVGVACGFVTGFTSPPKTPDEAWEPLPKVHFDFVLEVIPPRGGEVELGRIRKIFYRLRERLGMNIRWISFDQFQSADSVQILRQQGFITGTMSVDRTPVPYEFLKQALYDQRVKIPAHAKLQRELQELEFDVMRNKVDHPPNGSKDLSDALAGVVYGLTIRRETWARWNIFPEQSAPSVVRRIRMTSDDCN